MNPWLLGGGLVLLPVAFLIQESAVWFSRQAYERHRREENAGEAGELARSARQARLMSRFLVAAAFTLLVMGWGERDPVADLVLVALALSWTLAAGALAGAEWESPVSLLGRALFRPLEVPGAFLRAVLGLFSRLPGTGRARSALQKVLDLEEERTWLGISSGEEEKHRMLATLEEFRESRVEDVMVPREEMCAIPASADLAAILETVAREGHSRYPVYGETPDSVVGVLHVFDLLSAPAGMTAGERVRPAFFTNDTKPVSALLRELQVSYNQMAVVIDEYGGVAGVVTVEDLLEELVGEIEDEYDEEEESTLRRLEPGVYWIDASMRIEEINEALDLDLEEGEYDTVAGLVLERLERIPRAGERVELGTATLEVAVAEPHRIRALKLTLPDRNGRPKAGRRP